MRYNKVIGVDESTGLPGADLDTRGELSAQKIRADRLAKDTSGGRISFAVGCEVS